MSENPLEAEGDIAADYLEGLLDIIDVDGDLEMDVENGRAMVAIVGEDLDDLVGDEPLEADGDYPVVVDALRRTLAARPAPGVSRRALTTSPSVPAPGGRRGSRPASRGRGRGSSPGRQ